MNNFRVSKRNLDSNWKIFTLSLIGYDLWMQVTELPFFASKVLLGRNGIEEIFPLGPMNGFER